MSKGLEEQKQTASLIKAISEQKSPVQKLKTIDINRLPHYNKLATANLDCHNLQKLAVIKLNGGLGTTMGCNYPKSLIVLRDGQNFLDLTIRQLQIINKQQKTSIPLILMNSFYTEQQTVDYLKKHQQTDGSIPLKCFEQSRKLRLDADSLQPLNPEKYGINAYYPPGHGEIFDCLWQQNLLNELVAEGYEYLFISNCDNVNATIDTKILNWFANSSCECLLEAAIKDKNDKKGGVFFKNENEQIQLVELSQIDTSLKKELLNKAIAFNTNNLWIKTKALKKQLSTGSLDLPLFINQKKIADKNIIQIESAMGSAISKFKSELLIVNKNRFLPVKSCADLFLLQSNLFKLQEGKLQQQYPHKKMPAINLGHYLQKLTQYQTKIPQIPDITKLSSLTVQGNISFGKDIKMIGKVKLIAHKKAYLQSGTEFKNRTYILN